MLTVESLNRVIGVGIVERVVAKSRESARHGLEVRLVGRKVEFCKKDTTSSIEIGTIELKEGHELEELRKVEGVLDSYLRNC